MLLGALLLLPARAAAQVCEVQRPDWSPEMGPATAADELLYLFTSLPGLGIIGALVLALLTRQKRYFAVAALFSALISAALHLQSTRPDADTRAAIAEGCVGDASAAVLVTALIAAGSVAALGWLWLRSRPRDRI